MGTGIAGQQHIGDIDRQEQQQKAPLLLGDEAGPVASEGIGIQGERNDMAEQQQNVCRSGEDTAAERPVQKLDSAAFPGKRSVNFR